MKTLKIEHSDGRWYWNVPNGDEVRISWAWWGALCFSAWLERRIDRKLRPLANAAFDKSYSERRP